MEIQAQKSKKTILVVDDAHENIAFIKSILVNDYIVKGALNGNSALNVARSAPPDLILLDVIMPEMSGYDVLRQLKAIDATRNIPVIFVTSKDRADDEIFGLELGAVDYIAKPIKPPLLHARIRTQIMLADALRLVTQQNINLISAARLRTDVDHILQHDLKSPLNVIIGIPQYLLQRCISLSQEDREYISLIKDSGYRMLDMINRSLDLFKMEYGAYLANFISIDLLKCVRGVLLEFSKDIAEKNLLISLLVDGSMPNETQQVVAKGEELLCHSLFSNLIKNAIEASSSGDNLNIMFSVRENIVVQVDNGGEVPCEIRDKFFDKFVTFGKGGGTGIGTYSAMLIAKTLDGSIILDTSKAGRTRIRVTLVPYNKRSEQSST